MMDTGVPSNHSVIRYDLLFNEDGLLNATALVNILAHLSGPQKEELYAILNVTSENDLINMYIKPYEEPYMELDWYRRSKILLLYVPPFLLIIGTIGNILSFIVLMRKSMRKYSAYNYLAVLGVTDTLVLYIGLLQLWLSVLTGSNIKDTSDIACKMVTMLGYTVSDYSVWLLIAVTVERYIVTVHALRASSMCTRSRARKVIAGVLIGLFLINSHFTFTAKINYAISTDNQSVPICQAHPVISSVWPWVDAVIYSFLPFIVITVLNTKIIRQVGHSLRNRSTMLNGRYTSKRTKGNNIHVRSSSQNSTPESSAKITIMLLVISFVFLITTLPINILMIVAAVLDKNVTVETAAKFKFARTVAELLMYTNHSINFFLYLLVGHKFRQQLRALFCRVKTPRCSTYSEAEKTQLTEMNGLRDKASF